MSHFTIQCRKCGTELREVYCAFCEHCAGALLTTRYKNNFRSDEQKDGIWKFNWLPVHSDYFPQPGPIVYKSAGLAGKLGLENLYIAFNGYWPERDVNLLTCTFKEFEAAVVLANAIENGVEGLVVASAGNTARAFSHLAHVSGFPVIIVVPRMCLKDMWYLENSGRVPTLVLLDGDYADSIDVARKISSHIGIPFEGGVKNIAKRDGLGIVMMEAVSAMGRLPDYYFQAVGSGTGAIAAWEMAERFLRANPGFKKLPELHLAQNLPFAPMAKAWERGKREMNPMDLRPELIDQITTRVLSTRYPAYGLCGGVFDALKATKGKMYGIESADVFRAMNLFEQTEGTDIVPASGVAVAALGRAAKERKLDRNAFVLLNITGGGEKRLKRERKVYDVNPIYITKNFREEDLEEALCKLKKS